MLTNYEIKRLFWLLEAKFFAGVDTDAVILEIGEYELWFCLKDYTTRVYKDTVMIGDKDRSLFLDLLIGEFFYRVEELGQSSLILWVDGTY